MNRLLFLSIAVLLILVEEGESQGSKDNNPAKATSEEDLCKHSFHSFLCNPSKSGHKRRQYNGQKPGPTTPTNSNQLTGENSFLQSTQLRPDLPKVVKEPKLRPDPSNIDPVFQGPDYLPPNSDKPSGNLFGDNSFLDPTQLLPPTLKPPPSTTRRPTTVRPSTTLRPTTQRPTTPRPTTLAPRPTTTRTTTRLPITQRTTTEPNLLSDGALNSGTRIRPESVKPVKEDLCAHAFHSFLCDTPKSSKPRRIYNGRKSSPENTNILGENSFQQSTRVLPPNKPLNPTLLSPKPLSTTTTYRPIQKATTVKTTTKPIKDKNIFGDSSYLSPTNIRTTTRAPVRKAPIQTTSKPIRNPIVIKPPQEAEVQPDAAQSPSVRLRPDASNPDKKEDLCKHAFHSFLCDTPKPVKQRRIYNGQNTSPENTNILGANSFQQPSRILPPANSSPKPPPVTTSTYKPAPARQTTIRATTLPVQNQNIIGDNSYLSPSKLLPQTTRTPDRRTPVPTTPKPIQKPAVSKPEPDFQSAGAQNPSVRLRPDASDQPAKEDLCKHAFHSFLCSGAKPASSKRRVYNGQNSNILGANSFVNSRSLLPPQPKRTEAPTPRKQDNFQQSTNLNIDILNTASNTYLPPAPYLPPVQSRRIVRQNAESPPTEHHDHDHSHDSADHHHAAAEHGHDHAHGDHHGAHGDHHHHLHNITLEQLCRDPFHAFLCLNVDTSKRRVYDGNPAQGTPSEQDTLQALSRSQLQAASSVRQGRKIDASQNIQSNNDIPYLAPSSFIQENNAQFKFQPNEPIAQNLNHEQASQYVSSSKPAITTPVLYTTTESLPLQSATSSFLKKVREQVLNAVPFENINSQQDKENIEITTRKPEEPYKVGELGIETVKASPLKSEEVSVLPRLRGSVRQSSQRRPVLSEPSPTSDTLTQQPIYRQRRPIRRKQQKPVADTIDAHSRNEEFYFRPTETQNIPENANRRSDDGLTSQQEQPKRRKFGEKVPRRKKLPVQDRELSSELLEPLSPSKFVRGPRGIASDLAITNTSPEVQCSEPFHAFQCNPKIIEIREKRSAKEYEEAPRREGNMRGSAQGQEPEHGKMTEQIKESEPRKDRVRQKLKVKSEERVKVEETKVTKDNEKVEETVLVSTEDPFVAYQKGIEEELKLREMEENNRKDELKRRDDDQKNRREELKRREKEQEGRKEEDKRRKEEMARRKVEDEKRKIELKKIKDADKSDDDDEDDTEDDEEKIEDEEKDKLLTNYEKGVKADLKLREAEVKRREEELERREKELIRREVEEKRRLMEAERRRVQDKRIEEELERQRLEKIRVAEELVRRQEEDDRRSAAKLKAESN